MGLPAGVKVRLAHNEHEGKEYLLFHMEGVPISHQEVPVGVMPVLKNGYYPEGDLTHLMGLQETPLVGDVTIIKRESLHTIEWASSFAKNTRSRFMMFPEVFGLAKTLGRAEVKQIGDELVSHPRLKIRVGTRPFFGSLGTQGVWNQMPVAPFMAWDNKSCGEHDRIAYFPVEKTARLDPNCLICFVRDVRPAPKQV